ncbi:hypothetical protein DPMN_066684 [Dreissena polymorpha]|uniref:Uncharacterized protein n=1 Tax=Dreissena polymorpha TaxID=45954 RepID=A0A9D4BV80_DREPO|nr:hypothetical protein DPMN_066684 [Dreissena polymorpha]
MRAFIILCFFIVVRANTTVQSVSSYGLQNCYCNVCDPTKSIGKIYDGSCYFISIEQQFKVGNQFSTHVNVRKTVNSTDYNAYDVVIFGQKNIHLKTVFTQVSNEFILNNIQGSIKIALFNNKDRPAQCVHLFKRKYLGISCETANVALLKADRGEFVTVSPFNPRAYKTCSFDENAAASITSPKTCFVVNEDGQCLPAVLQTEEEFQNAFDYLINRTHDPKVNAISQNLMFKIDSLNETLELNDYAIVYSRVSYDENNTCLYIDVNEKSISYEDCTTKRTLCQIRIPGMGLDSPSDDDSKINSFWVLFIALTFVVVSLVIVIVIAYVLQGFQSRRLQTTTTVQITSA